MVGLTTAERQTGREAFDFYCFLIWPFIEAAWLGAVSLISLTTPLNVDPNIVIEYNKAQTSAQLVSQTHFSVVPRTPYPQGLYHINPPVLCLTQWQTAR